MTDFTLACAALAVPITIVAFIAYERQYRRLRRLHRLFCRH